MRTRLPLLSLLLVVLLASPACVLDWPPIDVPIVDARSTTDGGATDGDADTPPASPPG